MQGARLRGILPRFATDTRGESGHVGYYSGAAPNKPPSGEPVRFPLALFASLGELGVDNQMVFLRV